MHFSFIKELFPEYDVIADVSEITDYYCWFKAKEMKYRIIPE